MHEGTAQGLLWAQGKARRSSGKMVDVSPVMLGCSALPGRSFTHRVKQSLENDLSKIKFNNP